MLYNSDLFFSPTYNSEIPNLDIKEGYFFNSYNENESYSFLYSENNKLISVREGPTNYKTNENVEQLSKVDICTLESIKTIFSKNSISILDNYEYDSNKEKAEMKFMGKKRKKSNNSITNKEGLKYRKGRKERSDCTERYHNKNSPDNIIKKIKAKLFENILQFINNILNQNNINEKKKILKDIDYKYINRLKKDYDLGLLDTPIKDLLSFDVSPKFKDVKNDFNRKKIEGLMEKKNDNEFLIFALNMKFREWLDLFTLKKDIKDFSKMFYVELGNNMTRVDNMLKDIIDKNNDDNNYIISFIFYLFNYENWFIMKKSKKK
jgi:hypothetical protein